MNTISAQEIKRRGISAVDDDLKAGPVYVIKNNRPQYVILTEERYKELLEEEEQGYLERIKKSLNDAKAGRTHRFKNAATLIKKLEQDE